MEKGSKFLNLSILICGEEETGVFYFCEISPHGSTFLFRKNTKILDADCSKCARRDGVGGHPDSPRFPFSPLPPQKRGIKGFKILSILTPSKVLCENAAEATGWVGGRALEKKPGIIQGGFKFRGPPTHIFPGGEKRWEIPLSRIWVTRGR